MVIAFLAHFYVNGTFFAYYWGMEMQNMVMSATDPHMTITEIAQIVGISPKTIVRWERMGKIRKPKRNWRHWRVYDESDLSQIRQLHEILIEAE